MHYIAHIVLYATQLYIESIGTQDIDLHSFNKTNKPVS